MDDFDQRMRAKVAAAGVVALDSTTWSRQRALDVTRENRARHRSHAAACMDPHVAAVAEALIEDLNVDPEDIVDVTLMLCGLLSTIALIHQLSPAMANIGSLVADDIERTLHKPTARRWWHLRHAARCRQCGQAWPCRVSEGGR
ncbi:hypothetical protein [Nocardiopsis sp. NPDC057823]|uniref:hypothetical protein n=1 Tax=Nocardiopsis sp. NPDC057823 TaxID=3346256 RepID=UPI003670132C